MSREPRRPPACSRCYGWGRFACGECRDYADDVKPYCRCKGSGKVPCPSCNGTSRTALADEIMEGLAMAKTQVIGGGAWMAMDDDPRHAPSFIRLLTSITGVTFMGEELCSIALARVLNLPHGRIVVAPARTVLTTIGPRDIDTGIGWAWGGRGVTVVLVLCQDEPGGMPVRIHLIRGELRASCASVFPWMGLERDMMSGALAYTMEGMLRMMADEIMEEVRG